MKRLDKMRLELLSEQVADTKMEYERRQRETFRKMTNEQLRFIIDLNDDRPELNPRVRKIFESVGALDLLDGVNHD